MQIKKLAAFDVSEMADACGLDEVTIRGWLGRNSSDELQDDPAEATSLPTEARPLLRAWLVGKAAELSGRSELAEGQKGVRESDLALPMSQQSRARVLCNCWAVI